MTTRDNRVQSLIKFDPRRYREIRGDEVIATVLDVSDGDGGHLRLGTQIDLILRGLQVRFGVTGESLLGRSLNRAAMPGMVMAANFGLLLFIFGDIPRSSWMAQTSINRFGWFVSIGPFIYLVWIVGTIAAFEWPTLRRSIALLCVGLSAVAMVVGKLNQISPNFWQVSILISLGMPCVLDPVLIQAKRRVLKDIGVGLFGCLALLCTFLPDLPKFNLGSFYWFGTYYISHELPRIDLVFILIAIGLTMIKRWEWLGAMIILSGPIVVVAVIYPFSLTWNASSPKVALPSILIWIFGAILLVFKSRFRGTSEPSAFAGR